MAAFAPQIEVKLPSGDSLVMTEDEYTQITTGMIDLARIFASAPPEKLGIFREEDVKAFVDWTNAVQPNENKPIGANTAQGQAAIDAVIGVADTSLPPEARSFLNAIAQAEGGTYTNRFGNKEMEDPTQHPMKVFKEDGKYSSASGRYQINKVTWPELQAKYPDLVDFSPVNQDRAAWRLAQDRYASNTGGRSLLEDLRAGDQSRIKEALSGTWEALKSKPFRYELPAPDAKTPPVGAKNVQYDLQGKIRKGALTQDLETKIGEAVGQVFGQGYTAKVYSGGQESNAPGEGTGSVRHNAGHAGDIYVVDPQGNVVQDTAQLDKLKNYWLEKGLGSVGTYMQGGGMHLDEWTQDKLQPGMALTWSYNK
jgi:muramidase (phage lysozyme)